MFRFRQFLVTRLALPRTQLIQNAYRQPPARAMASGGQARLTGPVGPISLALLVVGGGSFYWYAEMCRVPIYFIDRENAGTFCKKRKSSSR